ncbi:hypothetical protein [Wolbachia endosymbiont of Cantharis cryptica]|uniref:hypothetical protein n=1 Tax=Wolbachia endosymbiont of Cantharis cryptica TaxID=3066132 RepID=UPI00376F449A
MTKKKIVTLKDLKGKKYTLNIDRSKLDKGILAAIRGIGGNDIQSKIKNKKEEKPGRMPSPRDTREKSINWGEGLGDVYNKESANYQINLNNPFLPASRKVKLGENESIKLNQCLNAMDKAKNVGEVNNIVDQALDSGIRINAYNKEQKSFAESVISNKNFKQSTEDVQEYIMHKLMIRGAFFKYPLLQSDKKINEIHEKLHKEVKPQIDKQHEHLRKVVENAIQGGTVEDVGIDNKTFFIKFSEGSTVETAKVLEGTRNLGLNEGWVESG